MNVSALDALVQSSVLADFAHRNLNQDVADFATCVPTTENIATALQRRLQAGWKSAFPGTEPALDRIRVRETRNNSVELRT